MNNSVQLSIMDAVGACATETVCATAAQCITRALVQLAQCDVGQSPLECNTATASFVLVEQLRRLIAGAATVKCRRADKLRAFSTLCGKENGADALIRQVSVALGSVDAINDEMTGLARRRLFHGTVAIILSFALPGLLAVFSLTHVKIVLGWRLFSHCTTNAGMQLVALCMIFVYVNMQHGLFYALCVVGCCGAVMFAELSLMAFVAKKTGLVLKNDDDDDTDRRPHRE